MDEVLIIDLPDLEPPLSASFRVRNCAGLSEALPFFATETSGVVILSALEDDFADLVEVARSSPGISFFWLIENPSAASRAGVSSLANVTLLPFNTGVAWLKPLIAKTFRDQEQRRESSDLLEGTVSGTVSTLFEVLSITDPYSASLGKRLRYAVDLFCRSAGLELTWEIETAALIAEIGVLTVPARVIMKSQSGQELSKFEKDLIAHIPERGADLLQQVPSLQLISKIVRYQGKHFDGGGLPNDGVAGERIPLGARVLKILNDLFKWKDDGKSEDEAVEEMRLVEHRYDPQLLASARGCFDINVPSNIAARTLPLTVRDLKPGQLLVSKIMTEDGVLLIRDGQVISAQLLHKLRNFAFTSGIKEPIHVIDLLKSSEMTTVFQDIAQSETTFIRRPRSVGVA
jgi:hypothetical protein